jgi:hypothetical protein
LAGAGESGSYLIPAFNNFHQKQSGKLALGTQKRQMLAVYFDAFGAIGKLHLPHPSGGELTESPTFQAVRQTGLFGMSSRPVRQADFQILTPGERKPCGALLLNRAQDPAGISDCEHVVWKIPRDYASSTYDCTRSDLDARKDNRS